MKENIYKGLNQYLADVGVLYIKLHNLHWNVIGSNFKSTHEYLETLYDEMTIVLDETAEVLKMNNQTPLASMKSFLEVTSIKELDSKDYSVKEAIEITLKDMEYLHKSVSDLRALAIESDCFDVISLLEDNLKNYNKTIWFLNSMSK